jgi:hypothetical protein
MIQNMNKIQMLYRVKHSVGLYGIDSYIPCKEGEILLRVRNRGSYRIDFLTQNGRVGWIAASITKYVMEPVTHHDL